MCMESMKPGRNLEMNSRPCFRRPKYPVWSFRRNPVGTANRRGQLNLNMVKPAIQKYRRADARPDRFVSCYRKAEGAGRDPPSGVRAPENTTQYLMNIAYRDMVSDGELPFLAETLGETDSDLALSHGRCLWTTCASPNHAYGNASFSESAHTSEGRDSEETLSSEGAPTSEERAYAASLAFQQRDFDHVFQL